MDFEYRKQTDIEQFEYEFDEYEYEKDEKEENEENERNKFESEFGVSIFNPLYHYIHQSFEYVFGR